MLTISEAKEKYKGKSIEICPREEGVTAYSPGEYGVYQEGKPLGVWGLQEVVLPDKEASIVSFR